MNEREGELGELVQTRGEQEKSRFHAPSPPSQFHHPTNTHQHPPNLRNPPQIWQNKASSPSSALQSVKGKISRIRLIPKIHGTSPPTSRTSPPPSRPTKTASSSQTVSHSSVLTRLSKISLLETCSKCPAIPRCCANFLKVPADQLPPRRTHSPRLFERPQIYPAKCSRSIRALPKSSSPLRNPLHSR